MRQRRNKRQARNAGLSAIIASREACCPITSGGDASGASDGGEGANDDASDDANELPSSVARQRSARW